MTGRLATVSRETSETRVELSLNLEGSGVFQGGTGIGFFDHMLNLATRHGRFDLELAARGDLQVDDHHLVEDVGIVFGQVLAKALADKRGIQRYGSVLLPMDEVLVAVAVDLSGRPAFRCNYAPVRENVGGLSTEMVRHFFNSMAMSGKLGLHIRFLDAGENEHHRVEAMFKGFGKALRMAAALDPQAVGEIPSTKDRLSD